MQGTNGYPQCYHVDIYQYSFSNVKTTLNVLIYNFAAGSSKVKYFDIFEFQQNALEIL